MKKFFALLLALAMIFSLCACGSEEKTGTKVNVNKESEGKVTVGAGVVNPMKSATQESIEQELGITIQIPAGAEEVNFYTIDTDPVTSQMSFMFDGDEYTYRVMPSAEFKDISGMYYEWEETETAEVGYNEATVSWNDWTQGVIMWFDTVPGIMYSLAQGTNATYNSLEIMANTLYQPVQGDVDGDVTEESETEEELPVIPSDPDSFKEAFVGTLAEIHDNLEIATAGSTLKAAYFAGRMMDLLTEDKPDTSVIKEYVQEYASALSEDELEELKQQTEALNSAAESLNNGSSGQTLLEECGYEALYAPWDSKTMAKYFDAMLIE